MKLLLLLLSLCWLAPGLVIGQGLETIEQDYPAALARAEATGKLLLIDFYTTWCAPCKELDKLVLRNDSVQRELSDQFVLLRYDAESDTTFHLAKKHHVSSYPTGLILSPEGYVLTRRYGFPGNDYEALSKSFLEFTEEGLRRSRGDSIIAGYSKHVDGTGYPRFYADYVNRTNIRIDSSEFQAYWNTERNIFSEPYFATLRYFAGDDIPEAAEDRFLRHKETYTTLYGSLDVDVALMFMTFRRLRAAASAVDRVKFAAASEWARAALDEDFAEDLVQRYGKELLSAESDQADR